MNFATIDIGYKEFAISFWLGGHLVDFRKFSLCETKAYNQSVIIKELDKKLTGLLPRLERCKYIYIEGQYNRNIRAIRIESQLYMWFYINSKDIKIKTFPASKKYIWCDKKIYSTKLKRKRWVVEYVKDKIPQELISLFNSYEKKDDIADTIIMGLVLNFKNNNK